MNVNKILDQWKSSRMVWKSYVASLTLKQSCKIFGQNTSAGHIKSFRPKQCCSIFPGDNQSVMTGFNVFQIKISWKYEFLNDAMCRIFPPELATVIYIYKVMAFQFRMYHARNVLIQKWYTDVVWKARIQSLQDFLFIIIQVRIYDVYCMKQEGYWYVP